MTPGREPGREEAGTVIGPVKTVKTVKTGRSVKMGRSRAGRVATAGRAARKSGAEQDGARVEGNSFVRNPNPIG